MQCLKFKIKFTIHFPLNVFENSVLSPKGYAAVSFLHPNNVFSFLNLEKNIWTVEYLTLISIQLNALRLEYYLKWKSTIERKHFQNYVLKSVTTVWFLNVYPNSFFHIIFKKSDIPLVLFLCLSLFWQRFFIWFVFVSRSICIYIKVYWYIKINARFCASNRKTRDEGLSVTVYVECML